MTVKNSAHEFRRFLPILCLTLGLAGCTVVSEQPLFDPSVAPTQSLAEGLWALSGPGCDVVASPHKVLPSCAAAVIINHGRMSWDTAGALSRSFGPMAQGMANLPLPKISAYVLVDGRPKIVELLNGATNEMTPSPASGGVLPKPLKPGYMALRSLGLDKSGHIIRAVIWPVACPLQGSPPADFQIDVTGCVAGSSTAVRRQAQVPPLMQSAFVTWINSGKDKQ